MTIIIEDHLNRIMTEEYLKQLNLDELIQLMMKNIQELQAMHKADKQQPGIDEKRRQVELLHKIIAEKKERSNLTLQNSESSAYFPELFR